MIDHATQYAVLKYLWASSLFVSQADAESINKVDLHSLLVTFSCSVQHNPSLLPKMVVSVYDLSEAALIEPSPSLTVTDGNGTPLFYRLTEKADQVLKGGPLRRRPRWV